MDPLVFARLLAELGAAVVAPPRCAACDARVGLRRVFCPDCARAVERLWHCSAVWSAPFLYGGPVARAIARLKYEDAPHLARPLGALLEAAARELTWPDPDLVVPVPLHVTRLVKRGYNQAALLAAPVARALGASLAHRALVRVRDTPQQVALARGSRLVNVRGAFVAEPRKVRGASVLLVDDVRTTGATLLACESALQAAGAGRVRALVLAAAEGL